MTAPALADSIQLAAIIGGIVTTVVVVFLAFHASGAGGRKTPRDRRVSELAHDRRTGIERRSAPRRQTDSYDRRRDLFAARQVRAVSGASFQRKQILNVGEYRVFRIIEAELTAFRLGHRAFPQTSLGEIIKSSDEEAFFAINAKRVDMLSWTGADGRSWRSNIRAPATTKEPQSPATR